jgi:hypothetical protein
MSDRIVDYEHLIARRLDGEITAEEAMELDRALLRDRELRRTFEAYEHVDLLSSDVLSSQIGDRSVRFDPSVLSEPRRGLRMRRAHRGWFLIPGAIAAALLAMVIPRPELGGTNQTVVSSQWPVTLPRGEYAVPSVVDYSELMHNVNTTRRGTGRDIIGVITEDGNVYWIEVDRTRTLRFPAHDSSGDTESL